MRSACEGWRRWCGPRAMVGVALLSRAGTISRTTTASASVWSTSTKLVDNAVLTHTSYPFALMWRATSSAWSSPSNPNHDLTGHAYHGPHVDLGGPALLAPPRRLGLARLAERDEAGEQRVRDAERCGDALEAHAGCLGRDVMTC